MEREAMRELGCGKFIENRTVEWGRKREELYKAEGVWKHFVKRREHYRGLFGTASLANKAAQAEIDTYLLKGSAGELVSLPAEDGGELEEEVGDFFHNRAEFGEDGEMNPVRDLTWIYNNIAIRDVKPADAPSAGAYAHLKFIQKKDANMVDFFTKVYPRIIPSKSQIENLSKFNDDGREHTELLDRLLTESEDSQE